MSQNWTESALFWWAFAQSLWANEGLRPSILALVLAFVLSVILQSGKRKSSLQRDDKSQTVKPPPTGKPLFARYEKPVRVGGVTVEAKWRHIGIVATTGARKSTLLAMIADQLKVPCIIITGDHAPPLANWVQSKGGVFWQARGPVEWYPWGGELELAVQRVEYMFPAAGNDLGVHRGMFKDCARVAWAAADKRGVKRTLDQVMEQMLEAAGKGEGRKSMVENWNARLHEMVQTLGGSLGTDVDMLEVLDSGRSFMVSLNSFQDLSNRKRFASIAVLEALRAAETRGNIGVLIDEVGLVGADLFADAVRTFRVRGVTGAFASQVAGDFPPAVKANVNVWFLGQQSGGDKASREWASHVTFEVVKAESFGEHHLKHGKFYVVAGGRIQKCSVPTWKTRPIPPLSVTDLVRKEATDIENGHVAGEMAGRTEYPMLPPPAEEYKTLFNNIRREGECERWNGKHDRAGHIQGCKPGCKTRHKHKEGCSQDCADPKHEWNCYALVWWPLAEPTEARTHEWQRVHRVRWRMTYGPIPLDPKTGRPLTIDHRRTCPKDCSRLDHLNGPVTRSENSKRRWRVLGYASD